ncbi:MAG TPA: hypothetical protein VJ891_02965 [Casimicrobiaceae bacterium]|nr:hypothetical protein [Casimicrobiaceae bacterium]
MSDAFVAFVRRLDCMFCGARAPSEAHHWPPRSHGRRDDRTIPVCRGCHIACGGEVAVIGNRRVLPIPRERQDAAVLVVRSLFMERATAAEWSAFARDRQHWIESRGDLVPV